MGQSTTWLQHPFDQDLHLAACLFAAIETGRHNPCVVEYQKIPRVQQCWQIDKPSVGQLTTAAIEAQHAAFTSLSCGMLGNQLTGQVIFEFRAAQGGEMVSQRWPGQLLLCLRK